MYCSGIKLMVFLFTIYRLIGKIFGELSLNNV